MNPDSCSEWGLREGAAARGSPVSHAQFKSYVGWGLIAAPDEFGRWPADAIDGLVDVRRLEPTLRPLARRVLYLRSDYLRFPVPAEYVRRAMLSLLPKITAPVRKMKRVRAAEIALAARMSGGVARARHGVPDKSDWRRLLSDADGAIFESWLGAVYHLASVLAAFGIAPSAVPLEEHVTLAMLLRLHDRDIALRQNRSKAQVG